jgi:HAE1 family hydrophobic/amphiphilic exporter-1
MLILIYGVFTFRSLPVEVLPRIQFPLLTVSVSYPNVGPTDIVEVITEPLETKVMGLDGVKSVQSITFEGSTLLLMFYEYGINMDSAKKEVEARLVSLNLPANVAPPIVRKLDPGAQAIMELSFVTDGTIEKLQNVVADEIKPAITSIDGVSSVSINGIQEFDLVITASTESLAQYGITLNSLSEALTKMTFSMPSGFLFDSNGVVSLRTAHSVSTMDELENLAVATYFNEGNNQPVLLKDVATVEYVPSATNSISRTNGNPSIGISVFKTPETNTVDVSKSILNVANSISSLSGIEAVVIYDAGPDIENQIDTLFTEGIFGFLFAVAGVFIFLLNIKPGLAKGLSLSLRPTIVIALTIPVSILGGVLLMGFTDLTLNVMTLGGLALAVGRVVDDSIVVLENLYRHIQLGETKMNAALSATSEVSAAITSSTLATIVVFAPLAFIPGLVGEFFLPFCIAVSFALIASLVVSVTFVPVVGSFLLKPGDMVTDDESTTSSLTYLQKTYKPMLIWSLQHKIYALLIAFGLTLGSVALPAFGLIPITLFPAGGARILTIDISVPPMLTPEQKQAKVEDVEKELKTRLNNGEIENFVTTISGSGYADSFGPPDPNGFGGYGNIFVRLSSSAPESITEDLSNMFISESYGTQYEIEELNSNGPPQAGLELKIIGNSLIDITEVNSKLLTALNGVEGIENLESDLTGTRPEMVLDVDSTMSAKIGLTPQQVAVAISAPMRGQDMGDLLIDNQDTKLTLKIITSNNGQGLEGFQNIVINGPLGSAIIGDLVEIKQTDSPITIARTDTKRSATITGKIIQEDARSIQATIDSAIAGITLPVGVEIVSGGIFSDIAEGFQDIFLAMGISVVLVFLVVAGSLGSLRNALVILLSLPLAAIGALAALAITGRALGLPAMMGLLLLIGLVVTNAIVLIAFVQQLRDTNLSVRDSLIEGGLVRLRPILMTAVTTGLALLPLAAFVGNEGGGIIGEDLATVVIGGLASSTFLTLLIVPIAYEFMHETGPRILNKIFRRT